MEQRFKFRRVNEITGTFVLVIVGVMIAAVLWMGRSQRWFRSNVTLRITLPESGAAGIRQGSEVYFLGTRVGAVSDVLVDASGRMEARASIRKDFFRFVRTDSSAEVKRKFGLAGDAFFEITRGTGPPLPEANAIIPCTEQPPGEWEPAVNELRTNALAVIKKAHEALETWTRLGADLGETRVHLERVAVRVDKLAARLEGGEGTIGKLINDPVLGEEATALLTNANQMVSELRAAVTNLNAASMSVRTGTAQLPEIAGAVANEAKDLPGLVQQTRSTLRELERVIEAMQRHWLLRRYVDRPDSPASRSPSPAQNKTPPDVLRHKGSGFE